MRGVELTLAMYSTMAPARLVALPTSALQLTRSTSVVAQSKEFTEDWPPAGKRYCMNAAALTFIPKGDPLPLESQPAAKQHQHEQTASSK